MRKRPQQCDGANDTVLLHGGVQRRAQLSFWLGWFEIGGYMVKKEITKSETICMLVEIESLLGHITSACAYINSATSKWDINDGLTGFLGILHYATNAAFDKQQKFREDFENVQYTEQ